MPDRHGGQFADRAEVWRRVPGWPGVEASSHMRVRRAGNSAALTPEADRDGYPRVRCGRRWLPVHVAVCLAFHGRPEVRHLDGDRTNARPENLAWGSHRENEQDKRRQKREKGRGVWDSVQGTSGTPGTGGLP